MRHAYALVLALFALPLSARAETPTASFDDEPATKPAREVEPAEPAAPRAAPPHGSAAFELESAELAPLKPDAPQQRRVWYGGYTFLADVASLSVIGAAGIVDNNFSRADVGELHAWLYGVGAVGLVLGAPAVHLAHGQRINGGLSLGLRILGPLSGAALGYLAAPPDDPDCYEMCGQDDVLLAIAGGFVGAVSAVVVDHTAIAWKKAPPPREAVSWSIAPLIDEQRVGASVTGSF